MTGVEGPAASFLVGPKLYLAILWHQHQPLYKDVALPSPRGVRYAVRPSFSFEALSANVAMIDLKDRMAWLATPLFMSMRPMRRERERTAGVMYLPSTRFVATVERG